MMGVALGIDYGTKRVGVAISDAVGIAASPLAVIEAHDHSGFAQRVAELAKEHQAVVLVFGMPVNMDGSEHDSHGKVERLAELCGQHAALPVEYVDERLTTIQAERSLLAAGLTNKKRKQRIDQVAAVLLLQAWLDMKR